MLYFVTSDLCIHICDYTLEKVQAEVEQKRG